MNYPETNYIFFPSSDWLQIQPLWIDTKSCIWKAPDWYRAHYQLSKIPAYQSLQFFFVNVLKIALEPNMENYFEYIVRLKEERHATRRSEILRLIYEEINAKATGADGADVHPIEAIR
jgi:hypothetical protein